MLLTLVDLTPPRALARSISQSSPGVSRRLWGFAMAGDWIPMRCDLTDDPAVIGVSEDLDMSLEHVVGCLHKLWSWASCQTLDGNASSVTFAFLDRYIGVTGFADALCKHGWLEHNGPGLTVPKFDRHMSESAKKRAQTRIRVQKHRNAPSVTEALPEKRREEKNENPKEDSLPTASPKKPVKCESIPLWEPFQTTAFHEAWIRWTTHRKEIGKTIKATTMKAQLKKLEALGHDRAIAAIDHSIEQGYTGLYEPSPTRPGPGKRQDSPARVQAKPGKYDRVPITRVDNFPERGREDNDG